MKYIADLYTPKYWPFLVELAKKNDDFQIPSQEYLRDIAVVVWDIDKTQMVAFICAIMGLSETVYASHFILDKSLRRSFSGAHVLKLLINKFEEALKVIGKEGYDLFVSAENKKVIKLYLKHGARLINHGALFHKTLGEIQ